jgi:hypothetical protein
MPFRSTMLPLLAALAVVACNDLPTGLTTDAPLHATELGLSARVAPYSRAALFAEAVERVGRSEGLVVLLRRTSSLREHARAAQHARARGDTARQRLEELAHREAMVRFTAQALGDARIDDVAHEVRAALAAARTRVSAAESQGRDMTRARTLIEEAAARLADPLPAPAGILASASDAADLLAQVDRVLLAMGRLPALDDLFARAVSELRRDAGADAARALLAEHQTVVRAAEHAVATAGRVRAHQRLRELRAAQLRFVIERLGRDGVVRHVLAVSAAEQRLAGGDRDRRRVVARDYLEQARAALRNDDLQRALDRSTIAAGIVNALAVETP